MRADASDRCTRPFNPDTVELPEGSFPSQLAAVPEPETEVFAVGAFSAMAGSLGQLLEQDLVYFLARTLHVAFAPPWR